MAAPLLRLSEIDLSFGGTPLLRGAELQVETGSRLALVGRNGSGKSTLLKIAAGLIEPDRGEIFRQPGATLRYLAQAPDFSDFSRVIDFVDADLQPGDEHYYGQQLIEELGLHAEADPSTLSGGEARRAALARALVSQPDVLLLDEPTNHLDLPTIVWLEGKLRSIKSALVIISHDRRFLTTLSRSTLWIDQGQTRLMTGDFSQFEDWRDEILRQEEVDYHKLKRRVVREEHWLRYGVTARRKRNVRRLEGLKDIRVRQRTERRRDKQINMHVHEAENSGKLVVEASRVGFDIGNRTIVEDFSIRIGHHERIGLIGANGAGKTTLVKLLTKALSPGRGKVRMGANVEPIIFDQKRDGLDPHQSLSEYLTSGQSDQVLVDDKPKHVTSYLKDYLFAPEQFHAPISSLSGGERARLILAKMLLTPANLLVLDEPTNDLDVETLDLVEELVSDFPGAVIVVSHDRDFLDRTVTRSVFAAGEGRFMLYAGGYSDMVAQQRGETKNTRRTEVSKTPRGGSSNHPASKENKRRNKLSFKQQFARDNLPKEMSKLQQSIAKCELQLADPELYTRNQAKFEDITTQLADFRQALAKAEEQWLELEMLAEELGIS